MGKKKPQKTKEISVAIAEASSTQEQQSSQPQTPRKRGRPRKIINIIEKSAAEIEQVSSKSEDVSQSTSQILSKKIKGGEDDQNQGLTQEISKEELDKEGSSVVLAMEGDKKEENKELPTRRGRRKSKPIKSST